MSATTDEKESSLIGQREQRIEKLNKLRELGFDPYPATAHRDKEISQLLENFEELEGQEYNICGRITAWREHGKLVFADLADFSGNIQLYIKSDGIQPADLDKGNLGWDNLGLLDVGDIVEARGILTKTKRGEISLQVSSLRILTKTLRPLPNELTDKQQMFRRRYLDLNVNPERRKMFLRKSKFWQVSREFMQAKGFLEVETPVLEHVTGGADARPFVTHHNDLDQNFYMRISSELFQKRLIGGGFEKIFVLGPNFRNEGLSDEHLQEYYQLEWYWAYADYEKGMRLVKEMVRHVAQEVYGKTTFTTRGHTFDLADEWQQIDYVEIIREHHGIDIFEASEAQMREILDKHGIELPGEVGRIRLVDNLWKIIRKDISGPAFLINEPKFTSPLSKSKPDHPELTERFHIILGGSELGNGYSELNDPMDQLERFIEQQKARDAGDEEAQMLDIDFLEMLEWGMPPTCGYAHSERLFWFLEDVTAREGTLFPQLRAEVDSLTREIYPDLVS